MLSLSLGAAIASVNGCIDPLIINQNEVEKLLSGLNPSKAAGPDQISCRILKELSVELALFLPPYLGTV